MAKADISLLLAQARGGDARSQSRLFEAVYAELKRMAAANLRNERPGHTLQPSALVNEACLRLLGRVRVGLENRAHFFATAAGVMRHILVDHARARRAGKRDGALASVEFDEALAVSADAAQVLAVDLALNQLAEIDARKAKVFELRWFGGFEVAETASMLGVSEKTVKRDWQFARAWLKSAVSRPGVS